MEEYNLEQFPFLKYDPENEWCYGNMDSKKGWWENVLPGWRNLFYEELTRIKEILDENNWTLQVHQIKEKFGALEFYYGIKDKSGKDLWWTDYRELHDLREKYRHLSMKVCCVCGKPAKYISTGWICPYCEEHKPKYFKEIN